MKKILILFLIIGFKLSAQNRELVEYAEKTAYENKSYIYTKGVKLSPPGGGGNIKISAAQQGVFFVKPAEASRIKQNIPSSLDKNFIRTENILVKDIVNEDQIPYLTPSQIAVNYQYVDGLGRTSQEVSQGNSPLGKDVVKYFTYDNAGRSPFDYLPYVAGSANGQFQANYLSDQSAFYGPTGIINDSRPFTENELESSPLSRTLRSFSPGNDWKTNDRGISAFSKIDVSANILFWQYNETSGIPSLATYENPTGRYPVGALAYSEATDEEDHVTKTYTDFFNRKVLEEVQGTDGSWLQTYYVYDDQDRLRIVFPPEASAVISQYLGFQTDTERQTFLDRWAYQFIYDKYGRVSQKKVPGTGWYLYVYDKWDRLVLSQDPKQSVANQWSFVKYDRFNRPILAGIYTTSTAHGTLQTNAMNVSDASRFETLVENGAMYTLGNSFPFSGIDEDDVYVVNFLDNYDFVLTGWDEESNDFSYQNVAGYPPASEKLGAVKGYQTGSKVRVLGQPDKWLNSVIYYYDDYHMAQSIDEADIGGVVVTTNKFDFAGRLEKKHHKNSYSSLFEEYTYDYDNAGRVLKIRHSVNGATPLILVSNKYDELGRLVEKNLHSNDGGSTYLQSVDYQYNIRGWITHINNSSLAAQAGDSQSDLFGMEIEYNPTSLSPINSAYTTEKYYDGKISAVKWKTNTLQSGVTPAERIYGFDYDALSRIKYAYSATKNAGAWNAEGGMFDEEITGYDKHGNINGLKRYNKVQGAKTLIDDLTYDYYTSSDEKTDHIINMEDVTGNKLGFRPAAASDPEEYRYDENGNLKFDHNKSVSEVTYNHLNLPTMVQFTRSGGQVDRIYYTYDALGNKLSRKINVNGTDVWTTRYSKKYQYDENRLSFFLHPEGRVLNNGTGYDYEYFLSDYLGNTRVGFGSFKETASYRATMEPGLATVEQNLGFRNLNETRPATATVNYTPASENTPSPDRAAKLNGLAGTPIGPAKYLKVQQGDAVYMEVFARYNQGGSNTNNIVSSALVSALTGANSFNIANSGETATLWSGFNTYAPSASIGLGQTSTTPKAYLVYLFFDDANNFIRFGTKGISEQAYGKFEKLDRSFTATTNGHLYIYVANENNQANVDVYFDEFYIVHQKNAASLQVTQATDYYPFGLPFNEYHSDRLYAVSTDAVNPQNNKYSTSLRNRMLFQGKSFEKDLDLNWYDFEARMYEPALGRFNSVDPLAENFYGHSPYNFVLNNPLSFVDPDGRTANPAYNMTWPFYNAQLLAQAQWQNTAYQYGQMANNASYVMQQRLWAPTLEKWNTDMAHRAGNYNPYQSYGEQYASGRHGTFLQVMSYVGGAIPIVGGVAHGLIDARNGDYGSATLNLGGGLTELGAFSSLLRTIRTISTASEVQTVATKMVIQAESNVFLVTKEGVVLPKGAKIPSEFVENPFRSSNYGIVENGKFIEKLRIDPPTPANMKGPNFSHYHLNGKGKHFTGNWPWW